MKRLLIIALLSMAGIVHAQDQLFKKDNTKLLVKITEVSPEEIKYKLFSNLSGPVYVINKSEVSLIIFENGQHEVISTGPAEPGPAQEKQRSEPHYKTPYGMSKADSLKYYRYSESISLNFFSMLNMEVGLVYQKDFIKSNFNIIVPLAIGLQNPSVTESIYFNNGNGAVQLDRKLFEVGFGFNYYPSLKFPVNYYVGPVVRFMQYEAQQIYSYRDPSQYPYYNKTIVKNGTLSRYCVSITNGFMFRTRSRLMINLFGSLGFKNDVLSTTIIDPVTNIEVKPIQDPIGLYFWAGFNLGFCF